MQQNFSCIVNATVGSMSNKSCSPPRNFAFRDYSQTYVLVATILLSVLIPVIVLGNTLVLLAFATTRRLRSTTNYFVASLAVSDILVGTLSLPLFTAFLVKGRLWQFKHPDLIKLWTSIDMIASIASIVNLMYISIDRFVCIQFPFHYYEILSKQKVLVMILVSWVYGILNSVLVLVTYKQKRPRPDVILAITVMAFVIPLLVLIIMYARVLRIALSHSIRINARGELDKSLENTAEKKQGTFSLLRELKATRTLAIVVGAFVLCYIGYFVLLLRASICGEWYPKIECKPFVNESIMVTSFQWVKYFNSSLNPFIYAVMNGDMRKAFKRVAKLRRILGSSDTSSFELSRVQR